MKKLPTVVIIKSSPWKTAHQSRNHPEVSAIFDIVQRYGSEINFVFFGTSRTSTSGVILRNGVVAWDIQANGRLFGFTYYLDLIKLLFKYRPNLVIVLGMFSIAPVAVYSLLSLKSKYVPVFIGEFDYYGENQAGRLLAVLSCKILGISLQLSQRKILKMFTLSRYTREGVEKLAPNLAGKIGLISYPISPSFSSFQQRFVSKYSEEPILLTVAGIEPRKGLDILVKAVSLLPNKFKVIIKGQIRNNSYMSKLTAIVKNLNIEDRVTFVTDAIDYDALAFYYKTATLFVFPTREDCLGVAIMEALHCDLPVIATSVGGIPDMIENGVNGILVQADNPRELANAISLLLNDDALRRKLAENARFVLNRRYYRGRITLQEAMMKSIAALYVKQ